VSEPEPSEGVGPHGERESPLVGNLVLWVGFVVLVVISVFTVLLPELLDDDPERTTAEEAPAAEGAPAEDAAE